MDFYRPSQNKVAFNYAYSGTVSGNGPLSVQRLELEKVYKPSEPSVPEMTYFYSGVEQDVNKVFEAAGVEVGKATPLQRALAIHAEARRIQTEYDLEALNLALTGAQYVGQYGLEALKLVGTGAQYVAQFVAQYGLEILKMAWTGAQVKVASAISLVIGAVEGVTSFLSSMFDGAFTFIGTGVSGITYLILGEKAADKVLTFFQDWVAVDFTDSILNWFGSTVVGKWVNDNASVLGCERGGAMYNVVKKGSNYMSMYATSALCSYFTGGTVSPKVFASAFTGISEFGATSQAKAKEFKLRESSGEDVSFKERINAIVYAGGRGLLSGGIYGAASLADWGLTKALPAISDWIMCYEAIPTDAAAKVGKFFSIGIKMLKPLGNEQLAVRFDGKEFDTEAVWLDTIAVFFSERLNLKFGKFFEPKFKFASLVSNSAKTSSTPAAVSQSDMSIGTDVSNSSNSGNNDSAVDIIKGLLDALDKGVGKGVEKSFKEFSITGLDATVNMLQPSGN